MGRPGLLVQARPTKASSIEARHHSGTDATVEYTHALEGTGAGRENSKTGEHRFFSSPSSLLEGGNVKMLFSRGGANKNKAPFGVNKPSHIWKVKYQGYHSRVVPLDLVLGVVSSGHRQATNAQGRRSPTVKHGEAR